MTPFQWPGFTRMNCASRFLLAAVGVLLGVDGFQTCLELHSVLSCSTFGKQLFIILQFGGAHLHVPSIARERRKKTDCRVLVNHIYTYILYESYVYLPKSCCYKRVPFGITSPCFADFRGQATIPPLGGLGSMLPLAGGTR